MKQYNL